ncbi:MAG: DUF1059 domain-containing protein [Ignavibacteriae bacterium]|nr:DUF1059 domain-containing protein [Ignavibacteriota bacterium]
MFKRLFGIVLSIILVFIFSSAVFSQETMQKEMKKDEMKKEGMMMKSVECNPVCGFMIRSYDEKELTSMVMEHAKKHHPQMKMTEKDVKGMMKDVKMEMKKEEKKMEEPKKEE